MTLLLRAQAASAAHTTHRRTFGAWVLAFALVLCANASEDGSGHVSDVRWTATLLAGTALSAGGTAVLEIHADIQAGWHVYALTQPPGGPTALQVRVDSSHDVVSAVGGISAPTPRKRHDQSFDLDTETYSGTFELRVPVQIKSDLAGGPHNLPVSIRFQSCSERECRPPRTVELTATVEVLPNARVSRPAS